jgi:hypothetical protein
MLSKESTAANKKEKNSLRKLRSRQEINIFLKPGCHAILVNFLRNTSMPGFKFLIRSDHNLSVLEWLFWFLACVLALILSGFLIVKVELSLFLKEKNLLA